MPNALSGALHGTRLALGLTRREVENATGVNIRVVEERGGWIDAKRFARVWRYLSADAPVRRDGRRPC